MPKFAVYYVPQSEFYDLGTSILGYDVRCRKTVEMPEDLKNDFHDFDQEWVKKAQLYGFHLTIGDAIDFNFSDILSIEHEIEDILNCFDPKHTFELHKRDNDFITFWGDKKIVVLRYEPNDYLKIFQTLIVARVNTIGIGSGYLQRYIKDNNQYADKPFKAYRTLKFFSDSVLDSYSPHFTLLDPYTGDNHVKLKEIFSNIFRKFEKISVDSICLLVQMRDDEPWIIYKEFKRSSYLFRWYEIPGNDSERLTDFLKSNYYVDWVKTANIAKTDNDKTIMITAGKNFISLNLNNENTELNLKIDNGKTDKFFVKTENGKHHIYRSYYPEKLVTWKDSCIRSVTS